MAQRPGETVPSEALGSPVANKSTMDRVGCHLVLPDAHYRPGDSVERAYWAAQVACEVHADYCIDLGDHFSMESLSSYDRGRGDFGSRRYRDDVEVGLEAREAFRRGLADYNRNRRGRHQVHPKCYALLGNHEHRITRALKDEPQLIGAIGLQDLEHPQWTQVPFLKVLKLDGIAYSHYFVSGIMGRALGGEHPAYSLLTKKGQSCIAGHSHLFDYCERNRADGTRIQALVAGCFFEHDEDYAGPQVCPMWARGLVILRGVTAGTFDFEWRSLKRIREVYG